MKPNTCTCSVESNEQNCMLHKKSLRRNLLKEDEAQTELYDEEDAE